jgi:cysteamine dioxygenase
MAFPTCSVAPLSKVQRLYDACDMVFSSATAGMPMPATLGGIRWLQHLLGTSMLNPFAI